MKREITKEDETKALLLAGQIGGSRDPKIRRRLLKQLDADALEHFLDSPDRDKVEPFRYVELCREVIALKRKLKSGKRHHYDAPDGFQCSCGRPIDHPIHIPRIET